MSTGRAIDPSAFDVSLPGASGPLPSTHRARGHAELLHAMVADARRRWEGTSAPWDPARPDAGEAVDLGRGLLDAYALALHVLWTYQEAWADEGSLASARLASSVRRLLALVGYHPDPGFAATGLQHFVVKEGVSATLPPGFRVTARADRDRGPAVFETLHALDVSWRCNAMQPFLPVAAAPSTTGAVAAAVDLLAPRPRVPAPAPFGGSLADQVRDRFAALRAGTMAELDAARARQQALRIADVLSELASSGAAELCGEAFDALCEQLCEIQSLANRAAEPARPGPLSESQELLLGRLAAMAERQPTALADLEAALARRDGEPAEEWSRRLDQLSAFLDALVAGILQEARDQVVRLRGSRALTALDRALAGPDADLGVAAPGTDAFFLLPVPGAAPAAPTTFGDVLRPGRWLVVGERIQVVGPDGRTTETVVHHEAVRILRVRDEAPVGWRETATRVTFSPPLARRYWLAETVVLGNVAEITHGATVVTEVPWAAAPDEPQTMALPVEPLTWRRALAADEAEGRVPDIEVAVEGQAWSRRRDLRASRPSDLAYAVEITAEGGTRLRVGDGLTEGAAVPEGATVTIRARTGLGPDGNRRAGAIDGIGTPEPAVVATLNPLPVSGGVEAEDPVLARQRARAGVHALDRAVSVADIRSLTLTFGGVCRAAVFRDPLRHRDRVTVVVLGERGRPLDDAERDRLRRFLVARTPPGVSVTVRNGDIVPVSLRLTVRVEPGRDPLAVVGHVRYRLGVDEDRRPDGTLAGLLAPGRPDLGDDVHLSDVYAALAGIPWLASAVVRALHRADEPPARHDRIAVGPRAVPVWGAAPGGEAVAIAWEEAVDR